MHVFVHHAFPEAELFHLTGGQGMDAAYYHEDARGFVMNGRHKRFAGEGAGEGAGIHGHDAELRRQRGVGDEIKILLGDSVKAEDALPVFHVAAHGFSELVLAVHEIVHGDASHPVLCLLLHDLPDTRYVDRALRVDGDVRLVQEHAVDEEITADHGAAGAREGGHHESRASVVQCVEHGVRLGAEIAAQRAVNTLRVNLDVRGHEFPRGVVHAAVGLLRRHSAGVCGVDDAVGIGVSRGFQGVFSKNAHGREIALAQLDACRVSARQVIGDDNALWHEILL